jgi:hypothetical protein
MMMRTLIIASSLLLASCSTTMKNYDDTTPHFDMQQFFDGKLTAYGMVQNRQGEVLRRFRVDMIGSWEDNKGKLDEQFYYHDGEQQQRIWYIQKTDDGRYIGNADDVVMPASGESNGFALNWQYSLMIEVDGENWKIDFNDWMYLIDEYRLINRAKMTKWGFMVGEVTLWIEKHKS